MNSSELKRKRIEKNLTQESLAKAIGKTRKTLNSYENGANIPVDVQLLLKMFFDNLISDKTNNIKDNNPWKIIAAKDLKFLKPFIEPILESHQKSEKMLERTILNIEINNSKMEVLEQKIEALEIKIDLLIDINQKVLTKTSDN